MVKTKDIKNEKRITKKIRDNFIFDKFNYCDKNNVIFKLGKHHEILDKKGNITWFIEADDLRSIGRGRFIIKIGNKWGIIDLKGKPLTIKKRGLKKLTDSMNNVEKMKLVFNCQEI